MNQPSYIAHNLEELFDTAAPEIQHMITGEEVEKTAMVLGEKYNIPVGSYSTISDIIAFVLIGALKPEDVIRAITDLLGLQEKESYELAEDMEHSIFEKARTFILGTTGEVVELSFPKETSVEDLRQEIMDTTNRGPLPGSSQTPKQPLQISKLVVTPGSRSQLLEQLQVLDDIPNDEEINERLNKIKEQIKSIEAKNDHNLEPKVPLQHFMHGDEGKEVVEAAEKAATYSKAPTKYNVDPYRELAEE